MEENKIYNTKTRGEKIHHKKIYSSPIISVIELDNEISLQLQSNEPPAYEQIQNSSDYLHTNPMKDMST